MSSPSALTPHIQTQKNDSFVHYSVNVISTAEHMLSITMQAKITAQASVTVQLPSWIPGSYMIRDFARNLHQLSSNDAQLNITRIDKQSWLLSHQDGVDIEAFTLTYEVYAYDLSVRSAYIDDQYAFFNGTSVFLAIANLESIAHSVELDASIYLPKTKVASQCPLASSLVLKEITDKQASNQLDKRLEKTSAKSPSNPIYRCDDYYELIDHPVLLGSFTQHSFMVEGYHFHLVFTGQHSLDLERMEHDLIPIIRHHLTIFGELPCPEYWFITLVCEEGFGGLEHIASTVLQYSRFDLPFKTRAEHKNSAGTDRHNQATDKPTQLALSKSYQRFLSLCSHELFHTWHVKRIKPLVMHQPDLSGEVYTEQMWIYEGFTSLYDDLSLARSGVISPLDYVQVLNENITRLLKNPGRHKQSVAESSFEAWSKFYKQDAGSINHIVSYYNKGAVVALCLDIMLRQLSNNAVCLDHVMQKLWADYGQTAIGTPDDVITRLCAQHFNIDIASFIHMATQTSMDLPLPTLLQSIGLHLNLRPSMSAQDKGGPSTQPTPIIDVGASLMDYEKSVRVVNVQSARAASIAGLQVNDIIVSVNYWQCSEQRFYTILGQFEIGQTVPLHVLRDGRLLELSFTLFPAINDTSDITICDESLFKQWLGVA